MHVIQGGDLLRLTLRKTAAFERGDQDQIDRDCCGAQIIGPICWANAEESPRSAVVQHVQDLLSIHGLTVSIYFRTMKMFLSLLKKK